jgi:hypothetical protein
MGERRRAAPGVGMEFLYYWKLASIVLTGVFAIYGLVANFRDPDTKKITPHGKIATAGLILSVFGGFIAQIQDNQTQIRNREIFEERTTDILKQIRRSLTSIGRPEFEIELKIQCGNPPFSDLCKIVSDAISAKTNVAIMFDDWAKAEPDITAGYLKAILLKNEVKHPDLTLREQDPAIISVGLEENRNEAQLPPDCPYTMITTPIVNLNDDDRFRFVYIHDAQERYILVFVHVRPDLFLPLRIRSTEDIKTGGVIGIVLSGLNEVSVISVRISTPSEDIAVFGFEKREHYDGKCFIARIGEPPLRDGVKGR